MDKFMKLSLGALSDLEQMESSLRDGDVSQEAAARELLKALIDASDGVKLRFWVRAIAFVASKAAEAAGGQKQ